MDLSLAFPRQSDGRVDGYNASLVYLWGVDVNRSGQVSEEIVSAREQRWTGLFHACSEIGRDARWGSFLLYALL
jgi:hypothetical protein